MIECFTSNIMYETEVCNETKDDCKRYLSAAETSFKEKLRKHTRDLKHTKYGKPTKLSNYVFTLKSHGMTLIVKWSIFKRISSKMSANYCKLYVTKNF